MRWRYLLIALLVVLLAADLGYRAWSHRPYVVTAWQTNTGAASVFYSLPNGGIGEWRFNASNDATGKLATDCLNRVEVGKPIPDCVRRPPFHLP